MGKIVLLLALPCLLLGTTVISYTKPYLKNYQAELTKLNENTPLYLPEAKYIRLVTLGFDNFFSDLLWFSTINYFGEEYQSGGKDYRWLGHMCTLVTQLDGKAAHVYEFCATMLSWVAKKPKESQRLLARGIQHIPDYWRLRYLEGFNYWYFLERRDLAQETLAKAAELPNCPPFVIAMASRLMTSEDDPKTAIEFLKKSIQNTKDPIAKEALIEKLQQAHFSLGTQNLEKAIEVYENRFDKKLTNIEELLSSGLIKGNLKDPFGGNYKLDQTTGAIISSTGKKGLEFFGKTYKTGFARKEWVKENIQGHNASN